MNTLGYADFRVFFTPRGGYWKAVHARATRTQDYPSPYRKTPEIPPANVKAHIAVLRRHSGSFLRILPAGHSHLVCPQVRKHCYGGCAVTQAFTCNQKKGQA